MYRIGLTGILAAICVLASCSEDGRSDWPEDYTDSFNEVWRDFDLHYSYFDYKNIDWDAVKRKYESQLEEKITYPHFIDDIITPMLKELKDLHVGLTDKTGKEIRLYTREIKINYDYKNGFFDRYFQGGVTLSPNGVFRFGDVGDAIGYILIESWSGEISEDVAWFHERMNGYRDFKALIIDVRPNNGGNEAFAQDVAGRFTESTNVYAYHQFRNGPDHDDFTPLQSRSFSPSGAWQFTGPVALLIGERCMSSSESFILMMQTLDHVVSIGDTTRGSSGNPREYGLRDGTRYRIPGWIAYKTDQTVLEDHGIAPDIYIPGNMSIINGRDLVLEEAIRVLKDRL
ncbi:S41 family peptidase [Rhodocaloribacter sp.]